jgi:polyribonucleotide nucleotidyltransferase
MRSSMKRLNEAFPDEEIHANLAAALSEVKKKVMRDNCLDHEIRCDGRGIEDIRPLNAQISYLPDVVHGSCLFERGQTQVSIRLEDVKDYVFEFDTDYDLSFFRSRVPSPSTISWQLRMLMI